MLSVQKSVGQNALSKHHAFLLPGSDIEGSMSLAQSLNNCFVATILSGVASFLVLDLAYSDY